jgi:precorrin-3B synthase
MNVAAKGWCPGALAPMRSGDGLIVRLRLSCGEMSAAQTREIAGWSQQYGNGEIDLTARGHLQLRGIRS